ncbi:hypothetical protein [uncultured Aquimarina sp.]|uniref:HEAT repeat domain-containing protein n=1 Tax=uncultured Aquimarina sp. TaxID=575652 RepID=UPI00260805E2|nr:hypothetical protein [uncultured Aquimarina sp.]
MKEKYFKSNTSVTSKPMIKVNTMVRAMVKMSLNQETESCVANCIGSKLIDVKMQLCDDSEGPMQLEFENGKILHISICDKNGIKILETPIEQKLDRSLEKNMSLKDDPTIVDVIDNSLAKASIITIEWVKVTKKQIKTRYIICGIALEFSNKENLIYIHEKEGIPRVKIQKKIDISRYKIHEYIWEDPIKEITQKEFYDILKGIPTPSKWETIEKMDASLRWDVIGKIDTSFLNKNVFDLLVEQLKDKEDGTRFFALFTLIDKFKERLSNPNDELADLMIQLLNDPYPLVVDRVGWALTIMGEIGLKKLLENANSSNPKLRWLILATIGKSAHLNPKKSIEILVEGLQDKNEDIRYIAMTTLIDLCPLPKGNDTTITDFDFTPIYKMIKPVAQSFIESKNERYKDSSDRYLKWIHEEEQKTK